MPRDGTLPAPPHPLPPPASRPAPSGQDAERAISRTGQGTQDSPTASESIQRRLGRVFQTRRLNLGVQLRNILFELILSKFD